MCHVIGTFKGNFNRFDIRNGLEEVDRRPDSAPYQVWTFQNPDGVLIKKLKFRTLPNTA